MSVVLGCDPGFGGALAWYDSVSKRLIAVIPMPLKPQSQLPGVETRVEICCSQVANAVRKSRPTIAVLERVNASPKMGTVSAFRFGEGFGSLVGVCAALELPTFMVYPNAWKAGMGLTANKNESTLLACKLFPEWSATFHAHKAKSADLAEAALIAHYGANFLVKR